MMPCIQLKWGFGGQLLLARFQTPSPKLPHWAPDGEDAAPHKAEALKVREARLGTQKSPGSWE